MSKKLCIVTVVLPCLVLVTGCARTPDEVVEKVLVDFGIRDKPADYESPSDRVFQRLDEVARIEMRRMNTENRRGEIKYQESDTLQGKYYKEIKVYEDFYPLDVQAVTKNATDNRGYTGYIEYRYRVMQGARKSNRTEAAAEDAIIDAQQDGRERYRYKFSAGGVWDGGEGELVKQ